MSSLKWRVIGIVALTAFAAFLLFPRNKTVRRPGPGGTFVDVTERSIPLRLGLDLQGGMHIELEVDESKQAVANKSEAIDRALKTVRNRIEGFGVSEPLIAKAGNIANSTKLANVNAHTPALAPFARAAKSSWFVPTSPNWTNVENSHLLKIMLTKILTNQKSVAAATHSAAQQITQILNASS